MRDSLKAANKRQGVEIYIQDRENGWYSGAYKLSNVKNLVNSRDARLVCMEEFWPKKCMWSCLDPATQDEAEECNGRRRCSPQLYDTSSNDSEVDPDSDYDSDSGSESESEYHPKQAQTLKLIMIRTSAGKQSLAQMSVSVVEPYLAGKFR